MILYIRTNFNLQDVVIVSPDAGGAKRYEAHDYFGIQFDVPILFEFVGRQSDFDGGSIRSGFCAVPQRTEEGQRSLADGSRRACQGQDGDSGGRHGGHVRDALSGGETPGRSRGGEGVRDRDSRDTEWERTGGC